MLDKVKFSQFFGKNIVADSANIGFSSVRQCKNFFLRPLGGLSMPPRWNAFSPGGTALDLGFITNIDYLFDGAKLLLQSSDLNWWDVTPDPISGVPRNVVVAAPGSSLSANLVLSSSQVMAFKDSTGNWKLSADQYAMGWATERLGTVPLYTTRYTADRAFATGFGPVFTDGAGNLWKLQANIVTGLEAITI